jgi:hypothetical protein
MMNENYGSLSEATFQLPCRLVSPRGSGRGIVCYLSYDAVRVAAPVGPLGVGSSVSIEIESPDGGRFSLSGEVRRVTQQGQNAEYSIRLVGLKHHLRAEICRVLDLVPMGPQITELKPEAIKGSRVDFV